MHRDHQMIPCPQGWDFQMEVSFKIKFFNLAAQCKPLTIQESPGTKKVLDYGGDSRGHLWPLNGAGREGSLT